MDPEMLVYTCRWPVRSFCSGRNASGHSKFQHERQRVHLTILLENTDPVPKAWQYAAVIGTIL